MRDSHACLGEKQVEGQMTRLRNAVLGGLAALAVGGAASSALATEPVDFTNRLSAATIGLPLGALPPPGLYTGLETAYLGMVGGSGASTGNAALGAKLFLPAVAQAVPLLYVPGWNFLGATYAMSVVQAFYNANNCGTTACMLGEGPNGNGSSGTALSGSYVFANTTWNPIVLSWNLGSGWFVSVGFNFMAPDGTHVAGTVNPDYWTLEPTFAVAYLAANWNIAGNFFYDINLASQGHCCIQSTITSGNLFYGDLHALYKFGKWSVGPVGAFVFQTTSDSGGTTTGLNCSTPHITVCAKESAGSLGGLVGYDFGPVDLQLWIVDVLSAQNYPVSSGSIDIFTRLGFRIWGPEAPHPLVAKN
jgi:hypothetical protein